MSVRRINHRQVAGLWAVVDLPFWLSRAWTRRDGVAAQQRHWVIVPAMSGLTVAGLAAEWLEKQGLANQRFGTRREAEACLRAHYAASPLEPECWR